MRECWSSGWFPYRKTEGRPRPSSERPGLPPSSRGGGIVLPGPSEGVRLPAPSFQTRGSNAERINVRCFKPPRPRSPVAAATGPEHRRLRVTTTSDHLLSWFHSGLGREARRGRQRPTLPSWMDHVGLAGAGAGGLDRTRVSWSPEPDNPASSPTASSAKRHPSLSPLSLPVCRHPRCTPTGNGVSRAIPKLWVWP